MRRNPLRLVLAAFSILILFPLAGFAAPRGPHDQASESAPTVQQHEPPAEDSATESEEGEGDDKGDEKDDEWNVDEPPESLGPTYEVDLEVDEGTWMSLDVSPDGSEIVFDLLGDLYTLPIGGGTATPLTSGLAWDMQPRYSPDGGTVAFTSDRGGGDNVWLIDRDGSNPRQVTEEDFRLLNSPAWTPDGRFVAARKHFTSRRSLGAGEIWLYHTAGGGGLQMVEKPNEQKDLGEPVFSPDGRYLYYSQDTTPGPIFEYNKDPNGAIYSILRLDRETGETETFVSGPGGAIRPTPSPDGRFLAFIRRVRTQSVLHLKDLESGEEWPLYRDLDRDMQETWAIHGVYPTMAWTPDSQSLVLWAGGKIRRVDATTGEAHDIPFRVEHTRTVVEALRVPVQVHPERFTTKMLRWVEVSPAGDRVVFEALGRIWVKYLPDGQPRRLTTQEEHMEAYPSLSRDGRWVVYATWDDAELGSVRVAPIGGGEGRTVTTRPGHYLEPAMSPDGQWIVYRRAEGGFLRTPTWSQEPGIYKVPAAGGGEPVKLTAEGVAPHFGASSDRVYLMRFVDDQRRVLVSLGLDGAGIDGTREQELLASDNASEYRVSPDGQWVAFREYFAAYVAPFVATGKRQDIGPEAKSIPVRKVSEDAGEYLHWSGDSTRLHWALGPDLSTLELAEALDYLRQEGSGEENGEDEDDNEDDNGGESELPIETVSIGFEVASDVPQGTVAVVGGRVITFAGGSADPSQAVIEDGTVVIEGNRIRTVGSRDAVAVPTGAHVIDAAGKTIIPGLVDVHWHGGQGQDEIVPEQNWFNFGTLAFGVTTIHDPSNDTSTIFAAAEQARAGKILAPRIFSTGTILYGAKGSFKAVIESLEDARFHVQKLAAVGAISVKSYNQPRRDQRQQVLAAARELGILVVPEGGSLFQHNMTMVVDGHTGIEHSIPVAAIYDDVRQLWSATRVGYTPTLVVGYGGLWGENYWYAKTKVWENERLLSFVPREQIDARSRRRTLAPDEEWGHFHNARVAAELDAEGVLVQLGAHGQREGLGSHWELWMFEQGGMTELEALRAATWNGAVYLGMENDIGSIEEGKLADLVVLAGNPLDDIRDSETAEWVILNGRVYDATTLDQVHPETKPREPFFWQRPAGAFSGLQAAP